MRTPPKVLVRLASGCASIRGRPDRGRAAVLFYGLGLVLMLGMALGAIFLEDDLWVGVAVCLLFPLVGWVFSLGNFETLLDFQKQVVIHGQGQRAQRIPFDQLVAILASAHTRVVRTRDGNVEERRFVLGLLLAETTDELRQTLLEMRRQRAQLIRTRKPLASHELSPRLAEQLTAHVVTLVDFVANSRAGPNTTSKTTCTGCINAS